jgi:hypothetical protein
MAIRRKILSTDKKYRRKFAAICRRSTEAEEFSHGSRNRIKVYRRSGWR